MARVEKPEDYADTLFRKWIGGDDKALDEFISWWTDMMRLGFAMTHAREFQRPAPITRHTKKNMLQQFEKFPALLQALTDLDSERNKKLEQLWDARLEERLRTLAAQGIAIDEYLLAKHLDDETEKMKWYRAAAEKGLPEAQKELGMCYSYGYCDEPRDEAAGARWFRFAAEQGSYSAQHSLGECYESGRGVPKDSVSAHMWYNLAHANYVGLVTSYGEMMRDFVEEDMLPEQIAEAERLAREWKPKTWDELKDQ